jgi:hypothetical protein
MGKSGSILIAVLAACGGSTTQATPPTLTNTPSAPAEQVRNDVVKDAIAAMAAGDVERLMSLANPKGMYEAVFSCKDDGSAGEMSDAGDFEAGLRKDFTSALSNMRGARVEVVSIKNELGNSVRRYSSRRDRNATFVAKGGTLSSGCVAKTDVLFHEVEARLQITKDGQSNEGRAKFELVQARGHWYVVKVPKDLASGSAAGEAVKMMESFQTQMCSCKDKACADKVNEDMTKWGTEMAKNAGAYYDERPDPDLAKKSADIMTKYTECMVKLMMPANSNP